MSAGDSACRLLERLDAQEARRFDGFVRRAPHTAYLQTTMGVATAPRTRLQHFCYLMCGEGGLSLTAVVRLTRLAPSRFLASIARGPIFNDPDALDRFLPRVVSAVREAGACTMLMNPRWEGGDARRIEDILSLHGFAPLPEAEQTVHTATGLIDLTPSEDAIFAGFKQRCRRQIRKAERLGLVVRPAESESDALQFAPLFERFAERKQFDIAGLPNVREQWRLACESGVFLLAESAGKLVGAHVALREGNRGYWLILASDDEQSDVPRGYSLLWEAIRHTKRMGCTRFDLAGMPDGEPADQAEANRMQFKLAFSPTRVPLVRMHARAIMPITHAVLFRARQAYRRSTLRRYVAPLLRR